jgi:DNA-binding winged helix-turn-helix (wHTH) protein
VGEDFSWLAETLASLARDMQWDPKTIEKISALSQRLIYGVTEKGLALSKIRLRGLGRTYINCLVDEGYDTPEAVADLPLTEMERLLPKQLAGRLYRHFHREYQAQEKASGEETTAGIREEASDSDHAKTVSGAAPPTIALPAGDIPFPRPLADIFHDETLLSVLRARLADAKDLRDLITDPPAIFMDERQKLFFYRGISVALRPAYFGYLLLLAKRPKEIITRQELYDRLWPGEMSYDGNNKPYERQISDHKRKLIAQIRKGIAGKIEIGIGELETLIFTRPKVGYMLNVNKESVFILP